MSVTVKQVRNAPMIHITGDVGCFPEIEGGFEIRFSNGALVKGRIDGPIYLAAGAGSVDQQGVVTVDGAIDWMDIDCPLSPEPYVRVTREETERYRARQADFFAGHDCVAVICSHEPGQMPC